MSASGASAGTKMGGSDNDLPISASPVVATASHHIRHTTLRCLTVLALAVVMLSATSLLVPRTASAATPSTVDETGPGFGQSTFTYGDLQDRGLKYQGGYAGFDDTAGRKYTSDPHGGYDTASNKCQVCHAVHRAEGAYELLRADSQADACEYCHVGSAHSDKTVYTANPKGTATDVGHTIGASPVIPDSTTTMTLVTTQVASVGADGVTTTGTVEIRLLGEKNKLFQLRWAGISGVNGDQYVRYGPTTLTCMSCHQTHNAAAELWRPQGFNGAGRLTKGYMLLRASPSGSVFGPDDMTYSGSAGTTVTVSYTRDGMIGYKPYTDRTTGLVYSGNTIRVPETTLTAGAYGAGKTIWDSPPWTDAASDSPTSAVAVNQYALSVWCADCHNTAIGSFGHGGVASIDASGAAHEATATHTVPMAGAANGAGQCYTCHRGDLMPEPDASTFDPSKVSCERCHYGTGSYAADENRLSTNGADWPHSAETSSAYMLGAWTVDASGSVVPTEVTKANIAQTVCKRCHPVAGQPAHTSDGGATCYTCHRAYANMDVGSVDATSSYHHVLGSSDASGDIAPNGSVYPASKTQMYCISCHGDHDTFNADRGANLRVSIDSTETTDTDFIGSAPYGICLSCHSVAQTKGGGQKSGGSAATPAISGPMYAASAHSYDATSAFGSGTTRSLFRADCAKCHTDGSHSDYQTTQTTFALHSSPESRLLASFGLAVTITGDAGPAACLGCHSGDTPGPDYYGAAVMTSGSRSIASSFQETGSSHPIEVTAGIHRSDEDLRTAQRHVACEDCHDSHSARPGLAAPDSSVAGPALYGATGVQPTWPAVGTDAAGTWASPDTFSTVTMDGSANALEAYVCFKCHSGYTSLPPTVTSSSGTYSPTDVAREFNPNNPSYHNVLGASGMRGTFSVTDSSGAPQSVTWNVPQVDTFQPGYDSSTMITCTSCHTGGAASARGPHGSSAKWIIDAAYPSDWKTAKLTASGDGMDPSNTICSKCHKLYGDASGAGNWGNSVHAAAGHQAGQACVSCHIAIPHGWKRPRLLGYTSDPAPYATTALQRIAVTDHALSSGAATWNLSDCQSTCHSDSTVPVYWP